MLGIYKNNRRSIRFWIGYWFEILDSLFCILTLGFWVIDTASWWSYSLPLKITRTNYYGVRAQIKWWFADWILILESVFSILTLDYLHSDWCSIFLLFVNKHFYKGK